MAMRFTLHYSLFKEKSVLQTVLKSALFYEPYFVTISYIS